MENPEERSSIEVEAKELVRSFSDKLQARNGERTELEQALQEGVNDFGADDRRRRQVFQTSAQSGCSFDRANLESEKIQHAWKAFLTELDDDSTSKAKTPWRTRKQSASVDAQLKALEVSTLEDVLEELDAVQASWVEKDRLLGGRAQGQFHKACKALAEHDVIFDMIPNQNNYAATLCGSLRMLIKASANHVKYAEELGRALDEISDEIGQANLLLAVMNVPEMERRVEDLYVLIFHMFRRAMSWYQSGGFRKIRFGLNEGLYDKLKEDVAAIKAHALSIQRDAQARGLAENRETRLIAESTAIDTRKTLIVTEAAYDRLAQTQMACDATMLHVYQMRQQLALEREERRKYRAELQQLRLEVGQQLANGLLDQAVQRLIEEASSQRNPGIRESPQVERTNPSDESIVLGSSRSVTPTVSDRTRAPALRRVRRDDLLLASEHLDVFITGLDERDLALRKSTISASPIVANKLQSWSRSASSQRLWLFGPAQFGVPSALVGAAVNVLKTAQHFQVPIIAHACDRGRSGGSDSDMTGEEKGIVGLLYSLIRQLIALLPEELQVAADLSADRFQRLDGSVGTWHEALGVFTDLMASAPPLLLCLVDGLNRLESGAAAPLCEDLLDRIDEATDYGLENERIVKLLFTSSGNSKALRHWLEPKEMCMVEDAPPTRQSSNNLGDGTAPLVLRDVFQSTADDD